MYKILINKLILDGIHGLTEKEKYLPQRFRVDIALKVRNKAYGTDSIDGAVDYRIARKIATEIIHGQSFFLLETITNKIVDEILKETSAVSVTVSVHKLDIWGNAIPGVSISRDKAPSHIGLLDFDIEDLIDGICAYGAVSLPILPESRRIQLVEKAYLYQYQALSEYGECKRVRQQISSAKQFKETSLFYRLRNDFTELLIRKFSTLTTKDLFSAPLEFNDMSLQKYEAGSIGITPHKDGKSRINLICVFNLIGKAEFALCDDRSGANPRFLDTTPGNVVIMRGPGFMKSTFQPFHFVRNIIEERIVFGLRQRIKY